MAGGVIAACATGGSNGLRDGKKIGRAKTRSSGSGAPACRVAEGGVARSGGVHSLPAMGSTLNGATDKAIHPSVIKAPLRHSSAAMPMIAVGARLMSDSMTAHRSIDVELCFD